MIKCLVPRPFQTLNGCTINNHECTYSIIKLKAIFLTAINLQQRTLLTINKEFMTFFSTEMRKCNPFHITI